MEYQFSKNKYIIHLKKTKMSSLKKQQKKLLAGEITAKVMEYLMGLNEKNEPALRQITEKSAGKIVKAYYKAIKSQHKKILKASATISREQEAMSLVYNESVNLIAS